MSDFQSPAIAALMKQNVNFFNSSALSSPVVISSRVRLARNLKNYPFPAGADDSCRNEISKTIAAAVSTSQALGKDVLFFNISGLSSLEREILLERRLASRALLEGLPGQVLYVSADESTALMVNEEDHLRMQTVLPGAQLHEAWNMVNALDDKLCGRLDIAYDGSLGFLTSCLSNVGTGIRVSLMLHLPALTLDGSIRQLENGLSKLGLTMRGMFGEGSENMGCFYQISNQSTLGESELSIIDRFEQVVNKIVEQEEDSRWRLLEQKRDRLLDKISRSFGVLRYSYMLSAKEAFAALSGVRLGMDMKMFSMLDIKLVNELYLAANSGHLQYRAGRRLTEHERDAYRALTVREMLKKKYSQEL